MTSDTSTNRSYLSASRRHLLLLIALALLTTTGNALADGEAVHAVGTSTYTTLSRFTPSNGSTVTPIQEPIASSLSFSQTLDAPQAYPPPRVGTYATGQTHSAIAIDDAAVDIFNSFLRDEVGLNINITTLPYDSSYSYLNAARYFDSGPVIESGVFGTNWSANITDQSFSYQLWGGRTVWGQINANPPDPAAYAATPFTSFDVASWLNNGSQQASDSLGISRCLLNAPEGVCETYLVMLLGTSSISAWVTPVPEPGTQAVLAVGLALLYLRLARFRSVRFIAPFRG